MHSGNAGKRKFFLVPLRLVVRNRAEIDDLCPDILCNLFDLEFPEMRDLDLDLATGYGDHAVLRLFNSIADLLAFSNVDLHDDLTPSRSLFSGSSRIKTGFV